MTFNNESSPRPRARVSTAPYTTESIPDARVVSRLSRVLARASRRVPRVPIAPSDRARARVALVASLLARRASTPSRVPRNTAPTHRERRRRRHRARVVRRRVGRRARRSGRSRVASRVRVVAVVDRPSSSPRVDVCGPGSGHPARRRARPIAASVFSSVYGILEFEFSPRRHGAARRRRRRRRDGRTRW